MLKNPGAEVLFDNSMCGIHDVQGATNLMLTGASPSRTKQAVYHLSVSWDKNDGATAAQMEMAAQRLLDKLKLQEHQALCVWHTNAEHPHILVIANRVHPDHGEIGSDGKKINDFLLHLKGWDRNLYLRKIFARNTTYFSSGDIWFFRFLK